MPARVAQTTVIPAPVQDPHAIGDVAEPTQMGEKDDEGQLHFEEYVVLHTRSKGSSGKVKIGIHTATEEFVAFKFMRFQERVNFYDKQLKNPDGFFENLDLLPRLQHVSILRHRGVYFDAPQGKVIVVMDYIEGGSLMSPLPHGTEWAWSCYAGTTMGSIRLYVIQLLMALLYLHSNDVAHGDVKPDNILVSASEDIVLSDFGSAVRVKPNVTYAPAGTPSFYAPELFTETSSARYCPIKADMWALGATLYCLAFLRNPFAATGSWAQLRQSVLHDTPSFPADCPADFVDLVHRMLCRQPTERITAAQALQHPFCTGSVAPSLQLSKDIAAASEQQLRVISASFDSQSEFPGGSSWFGSNVYNSVSGVSGTAYSMSLNLAPASIGWNSRSVSTTLGEDGRPGLKKSATFSKLDTHPDELSSDEEPEPIGSAATAGAIGSAAIAGANIGLATSAKGGKAKRATNLTIRLTVSVSFLRNDSLKSNDSSKTPPMFRAILDVMQKGRWLSLCIHDISHTVFAGGCPSEGCVTIGVHGVCCCEILAFNAVQSFQGGVDPPSFLAMPSALNYTSPPSSMHTGAGGAFGSAPNSMRGGTSAHSPTSSMRSLSTAKSKMGLSSLTGVDGSCVVVVEDIQPIMPRMMHDTVLVEKMVASVISRVRTSSHFPKSQAAHSKLS